MSRSWPPALALLVAVAAPAGALAQPAASDGLPPGDLLALHAGTWLQVSGAVGLFSPIGSYGAEAELGVGRLSLAAAVGHSIGDAWDRETFELAATARARGHLTRAIAAGGGLGVSRSFGERDVFSDTVNRPTWLNLEGFVERAYGDFVMRGTLGGGVVATSRGCRSGAEKCERRGQAAPFALLLVGYVF